MHFSVLKTFFLAAQSCQRIIFLFLEGDAFTMTSAFRHHALATASQFVLTRFWWLNRGTKRKTHHSWEPPFLFFFFFFFFFSGFSVFAPRMVRPQVLSKTAGDVGPLRREVRHLARGPIGALKSEISGLRGDGRPKRHLVSRDMFFGVFFRNPGNFFGYHLFCRHI